MPPLPRPAVPIDGCPHCGSDNTRRDPRDPARARCMACGGERRLFIQVPRAGVDADVARMREAYAGCPRVLRC